MNNPYLVKFFVLFYLPLKDSRFDQYSLSSDWTPTNIVWNLALFHSDSTNLGLIPNLKPGGKQRIELHNLRIDHVAIRSELKYLIGAKDVGTVLLEPWSGYNLAKNPWFYVRFGYDPAKAEWVRFLGGS